MSNMEPFKIIGLLAAWAGVTLAQLDLVVKIAVGLATCAYIVVKTIKAWRRKD